MRLMSPSTVPPLNVTMVAPPSLFAGEWSPLLFEIERTPNGSTPVTIRDIYCTEKAVQLDRDLFQRDLLLNPGESYRVSIPIRVPEPRNLPQESLAVQYQEGDQRPNAVFLPTGSLLVSPSLAREVKVDVEPLCTYEAGTKLLFRFDHQGGTFFKELSIHIEPEEVVHAGKTIHRSIFRPGNSEQFEAVIRPGPIEIVLGAAAMGHRTKVRIPWEVPVVQAKTERPPFRFLEPRRLSMDQISIYRGKRKRSDPVVAHEGAYPVHGLEHYQIVIRPQISGVRAIELREAPEKVAILYRNHDRDANEWTFLVEVLANNLFSNAQRLYYDVDSDTGPLTGEIHLVVKPPRRRYLLFAATAGAALTIQGGVGLFRVVRDSSYSLDQLFATAAVTWDLHINVLSLISIPLIWVAMPVADAIKYRLVTDD